jgi:hypothetical protein
MPTLGFWRLRSPGVIEVRDWLSESVHIIFKTQNKKLTILLVAGVGVTSSCCSDDVKGLAFAWD